MDQQCGTRIRRLGRVRRRHYYLSFRRCYQPSWLASFHHVQCCFLRSSAFEPNRRSHRERACWSCRRIWSLCSRHRHRHCHVPDSRCTAQGQVVQKRQAASRNILPRILLGEHPAKHSHPFVEIRLTKDHRATNSATTSTPS